VIGDEDRLAREAVERLLPPEGPGFFDAFWARAATEERLCARRWRRISAGLAAVTAAALAAAAVFAATVGTGSTVDRTVSCSTEDGAAHIFANATNPIVKAASALVSTGPVQPSTSLLGVDTRYSGFTLSSSRCHATTKRIPLTRSGLPSAGVYAAGDYQGLVGHCAVGAHVLLHLRLHLDADGKPLDAKLAVWAAPTTQKIRAVAFLRWSPKRLLGYLSPGCTTG
jgi:hypothetical protein